jgi:aminoglycoside phosphotransferase (APT) family kinase protein
LPRNPVIPGLQGIDRVAAGIPSEAAIVARYAELSGRERFADWPFILAFNFFRLAAIAQGVAKRATQGNASSAQADATGRMVPVIAALGMEAAEGL